MKTVELAGGTPRTLCNAITPVMATWTDEDQIYIGSDMGFMWRVSAGGGDREEILTNRYDVRYGEVFPDGDHVFASRYSESSSGDYADVYVLSLQDRKRTPLLKNGYDPRFVSPDVLLFGRGGDLFAVGFDSVHLEVKGEPWKVTSGVRMDPIFRTVQVAVSDTVSWHTYLVAILAAVD